MAKRSLLTRRDFIKAAGIGAVTMGVAPTIFIPRQAQGASKELKILVWSHFVPRFDKEWYDGFVQKWGEANGVKVTVDHIGLAEIPSRTAAEIAAGQGHDLIEWIAPPSQFEPSVLDLSDVVKEAEKKIRKAASPLPQELLQPELEEVLRLRPGVDDRPRQLPEEPLGEGRERRRAGDVGGPGHVRREDQEGPGDPARHRPFAGTRLEHGGPRAAVVVRLQRTGREGERGPEQQELGGGRGVHGAAVQGSDDPRGVRLERRFQQPGAHRRPGDLHPQLHLGVPLRAETGPRDRQGHLLHPRPEGAPRHAVQLRTRDLLRHHPEVLQERGQREEIPSRPGRQLRPGDVRERALQLPRVLRRLHPVRGPGLCRRSGREEDAGPPERLVLGGSVRPPGGGPGKAHPPERRREMEHQPRSPRPGEPGGRGGLRDLRRPQYARQRRPRHAAREGGGTGHAPGQDHLRQLAQEED